MWWISIIFWEVSSLENKTGTLVGSWGENKIRLKLGSFTLINIGKRLRVEEKLGIAQKLGVDEVRNWGSTTLLIEAVGNSKVGSRKK